jgi:hypothetical protein
MVSGSATLRFSQYRSLKAGACGVESMPPPLDGGPEQTGQEP